MKLKHNILNWLLYFCVCLPFVVSSRINVIVTSSEKSKCDLRIGIHNGDWQTVKPGQRNGLYEIKEGSLVHIKIFRKKPGASKSFDIKTQVDDVILNCTAKSFDDFKCHYVN